MPPLHRNPILYREWRTTTRPGKLWGTLIVVFGLLTLAFIYLALQEKYSQRVFVQVGAALVIDWPAVYARFAIAVLAVQTFIAFYVCFGMALDSLVRERQSNTHEFLVSLPISAAAKVVGLALGVNLLPLLVWVLLTPVGLYFGHGGGFGLENLLWLYGLMAAGMVAVALIGIAISSGFGKRRGAWLFVLMLLLVGGSASGLISHRGFTAVPLMAVTPFSILAASVADPSEVAAVFSGEPYHFYTATVPWQLCPLVFYLFLAAVGFVAATRKLSRPSAPPLPRWVAAIAFAAFQALLIGFFADSLSGLREHDHVEVAGAYMVGFLLLILVWGWFSTAGYAALMQWVERKRNWPGRLVTEAFTDIRTPLFVSAALLWAVTVGGVVCINAIYWWWGTLSAGRIILAGAIMLGFLLAYQAVYLLGCLLSRRAGGPIGVMLLAMVVGIPLGFASLEELEPLVNATPIGLFFEDNVLGRDYAGLAFSMDCPALQSILWAACVLALFFGLCGWRFGALLRISPLGRRRTAQQPG